MRRAESSSAALLGEKAMAIAQKEATRMELKYILCHADVNDIMKRK
jgi:hypothetical protein